MLDNTTPAHVYRLAGELHYNKIEPKGDPCRRSAISRAYYSAYLAARDAAGIVNKTPEAHALVMDHYLSQTKSDMVWIGQKLKDLRKSRNMADYDLSAICTANMSGAALGAAKGILQKLNVPFTSAEPS